MFNMKEYQREYFKKHREKIKEKSREWRNSNPGYSKRQYLKDPEKNKEWKKQWRKNNPDKVKELRRKSKLKKYNLSHDEWVELWEIQDGRCVICGKQFKTPSDACIDHNHETKKVRGLLCRECNLGIGFF